ncbi:tRNA(His) 5'-end guanylyltransferase [Longimicrobium terrae]|uniref:tRNA(His) guanylyltransferase n=2 Tax=Longimicrobium terrae TaxID=1639882 RepID=A0A841H650_9BACT|nr:tRNA(His) 5'-end guanylyltransferase [Longimicrobium terrae]
MGDRLKRYEALSENVLLPRLPVFLRLDGNSFSKFTARHEFQKPRDMRFEDAMNAAAIRVLEYCSGAQLAYVQSDEITILLRNDQTPATEPFLGNRTQKLASLTAGRASVAFSRRLRDLGIDAEAIFDCRVFVVPPAEVNNVFLWRQLDAFKNAVQGFAYWEIGRLLGRGTTDRLIHGMSTSQLQELIYTRLGINFNDVPTAFKRGRCIVPGTSLPPERTGPGEGESTGSSRWTVDDEIPLFNRDRGYIERFL